MTTTGSHELAARGSGPARAGGARVRLDRRIRDAARGGAAITDEFFGNPDGSRVIVRRTQLYNEPVPDSIAIPANPGIYRYADGCYFDRRPARQRSILVVPSTHDPAAHPDLTSDPDAAASPDVIAGHSTATPS